MRSRTEQGTPGVRQYSGYIHEEWDKRLRTARKRRDTLQQMQDDPTIAASLRGIDALARSTDYAIDPAEDAPDDIVPFVHDCLGAMEGAWGDKLSEILSQIVYGFSLFEVVYLQRPDGRIGWKRWAPRGQETIERWIWDEAGRDWVAAIQVNPNTGAELRLERQHLLHFVTVSRKQSPEGQSLIRAAFGPWYFKRELERIEAIGIERDMAGVPMLKIPADQYKDDTKREQWADVVRGMRSNEEAGVLLPSDTDPTTNAPLYEFSLVSTGGARQVDTDKTIDRYKRDIMRNLLVDWLMLGDEGGGSFALGVSKAEVFASFVQSLLDGIADTITEQAIKPLLLANGWPVEFAPTFRFEQITRKDVAMYADALVKLAGPGFVDAKQPEVLKFVYELIGLPVPDGGFDAQIAAQVEAERQAAEQARANLAAAQDEQDAQDEQIVEEPDDPEDDAERTFTEPLTDDLIARAKAAWRDSVPDALADLLNADVIQ